MCKVNNFTHCWYQGFYFQRHDGRRLYCNTQLCVMFTTVRILFYLIICIHNRIYKLKFTVTQRLWSLYILKFSRQRLKFSRLWHHAVLQVERTGPKLSLKWRISIPTLLPHILIGHILCYLQYDSPISFL